MKKKIAKLWVKALRSGLYRQGVGQLRDYNDRFCCFGVLCNLHAQAHPQFAAGQHETLVYDGKGCYPSDRVRQWAGLHTQGGTYLTNLSLVGDNDQGDPFSRIADTIEQHVDEL